MSQSIWIAVSNLATSEGVVGPIPDRQVLIDRELDKPIKNDDRGRHYLGKAQGHGVQEHISHPVVSWDYHATFDPEYLGADDLLVWRWVIMLAGIPVLQAGRRCTDVLWVNGAVIGLG